MKKNNIKKEKFVPVSFYECGKCKEISSDHKQHMIENGMLHLVVNYVHLFEK